MSQTMVKWVISTFGALQVILGQVGMEGLGFSMDAALTWIASAPFWEGRTENWIPGLLDRISDIMAEVFYLIYGLYIIVINNGN